MNSATMRPILLLAIGCGLGLLLAACLRESTSVASGNAGVTESVTRATVTTSGQQPPSSRASLRDPTGTISNNYAYYPGTEELGPDEIRIVACGTGMPAARRGQAAACFLVELGNGDKFLFDIGTGSMANIMSLNIPADYLRKIFLSHLHTDHWGDLDNIWAGGWTGGRTGPLEVWGPSGSREDMGTAWAIDGFMKAYNWDYVTRAVKINSVPGSITVHEFDYRGINEVIYSDNGV
ncbi:MAG: MBL fold metallo-hydrolase, partial [Planctomycetota bacterium]